MRSRRLVGLLSLAGLTVSLYGATKCYDVVPYSNCVAEAPEYVNISQTFVNVVDSLTKVSVWIGDTVDTSGYNVDVIDPDNSDLIAYSHGVHPHRNWSWSEFPLSWYADPVRGKTYKVVVSRPTGSPISFGYDPNNVYGYPVQT